MYRQAKQRFDAEEDFRDRARQGVVDLQAGKPEAVQAWKALCAASRKEFEHMYALLGIDERLEERGESSYNSMLPELVQDLEDKGLAVESNGAKAVFLDGYMNRDGSPLPMLVQKSDGGYNYATTDLAAIRHRVDTEKADRVLYVTDAGQSQHFQMVFAAAKQANYVPDNVSLEHVPFGLVQGAARQKVCHAIRRHGQTRRFAHGSSAPRAGRYAGTIAAVKYADLSMNRESNYRFSYERMLSLNGNTAPYMLYSYARICGILRKATDQTATNAPVEWPVPPDHVLLDQPAGIDLARHLVQLPDILSFVERDLYPNRLCE